jgi:hypothetical protein
VGGERGRGKREGKEREKRAREKSEEKEQGEIKDKNPACTHTRPFLCLLAATNS